MNVTALLSEYTNHVPQGPPFAPLLLVYSRAPLNGWGYVLRDASSGDLIVRTSRSARTYTNPDGVVHCTPGLCGVAYGSYKPVQHVTVQTNTRLNHAQAKMMQPRGIINTR